MKKTLNLACIIACIALLASCRAQKMVQHKIAADIDSVAVCSTSDSTDITMSMALAIVDTSRIVIVETAETYDISIVEPDGTHPVKSKQQRTITIGKGITASSQSISHETSVSSVSDSVASSSQVCIREVESKKPPNTLLYIYTVFIVLLATILIFFSIRFFKSKL